METVKILALALLTLTACHNAEPPQLRDEPVTVNPDYPTADTEWLNDSTPRIDGPGLTLRADTPGVMLITRPNGTTEFINLDTGLKVAISNSMTIDCRDIPLSTITPVKQTEETVWIAIMAEDGADYRLVKRR